MKMAKNEIDFSPANPENAAAGAPQPEGQTEAPSEGIEIAIGPEVEKKAEVVTMTPEEFAALKSQGDATKAMKEGIESLASKLGQPQVVQAAPANATQETPEEYFQKHSDDIFDKDKGAAVLKKYNEMVAEQKYGPILRGMSSTLAATRKELLETKDPYFKKYKTEVDQLVAQQPPDVQMQPDIYERAWVAVRQKHQTEIEEETVNEKVLKAVEAKLKELGIDPAKPTAGVRPAAHVQSEGRSTPTISTGTSPKPKARFPDAATKAALDAEAMRKGVDPEVLYRMRGFIQ